MNPNTEVVTPQEGEQTPQEVPVPGAGEGAPDDDNDGAAPEGSEDASQEGDEGGEESPPPEPTDEAAKQAKSGLQKRIDELVKARHEAERQLNAERLERLREQAQAQAIQRMQAIDAKEPQPDSYETTTDFLSAHARWASERSITLFESRQSIQQTEQLVKQSEDAQQQAQVQALRAQQAATLDEKLGQGAKKYKDFIEVLTNPELPSSIGSPLFDAVMASDNAVDIAYSLGKNPAEYERLLRLSFQNPAMAFKEVLKLDQRFSGASKPTATPPPPPQIGKSAPGHKDPSQMTDEEWMKWRDRDIRKRASR